MDDKKTTTNVLAVDNMNGSQMLPTRDLDSTCAEGDEDERQQLQQPQPQPQPRDHEDENDDNDDGDSHSLGSRSDAKERKRRAGGLFEEEEDKVEVVVDEVVRSREWSKGVGFKNKVRVLVSFENEAHVFKLRLAKPWDDLIIGLKEIFVADHPQKGCFEDTIKTPKLDGVDALFFDESSPSTPSLGGGGVSRGPKSVKCTKVDSNSTLGPLLLHATNPRLLVNPARSKRSKRPPQYASSGCPIFAPKGNRNEKAYATRWAFRWTHIPVFYLICILYTIHSSDIFPLVAMLIWSYTYRSRVLPVEKILYKFAHGDNDHARYANIHDKYLLNLRIKLANRVVPDKYGYYVVLGRDQRLCSYTMVPANEGSEIRLTIKHCTFIDSVLDQIAANENTVDIDELNETGQTWYNLGRNFFKVYGPFMSCDNTIANAKRVAVLVQTTGSVVSDTVISFQQIRNYWEKVLVFAVGSDLMNYDGDNHEDTALTSTTVFAKTDIQNFRADQARYRWVMNRIDREISDTADHQSSGQGDLDYAAWGAGMGRGNRGTFAAAAAAAGGGGGGGYDGLSRRRRRDDPSSSPPPLSTNISTAATSLTTTKLNHHRVRPNTNTTNTYHAKQQQQQLQLQQQQQQHVSGVGRPSMVGLRKRKTTYKNNNQLGKYESQLLYRPEGSVEGPFWPNSISFKGKIPKENERRPSDVVVIGLHRIERKLASHILKQLQIHDYNIIVCSGAWASHIDSILLEDKYNADQQVPLQKLKLHLELFGD
mmetsp:Transcript_11958/g.24022  ORF Transcript_11958/g.24022 Transcript_11958/m.24022 type:complete len:763 (+) Transcript_11958:1151-3439(+)